MHILVDTPPETQLVTPPSAIWPIVALTVAAVIGLGVGTAANADRPEPPQQQNYDVQFSTSYRAV